MMTKAVKFCVVALIFKEYHRPTGKLTLYIGRRLIQVFTHSTDENTTMQMYYGTFIQMEKKTSGLEKTRLKHNMRTYITVQPYTCSGSF